jgi:hypothetical protein
MIIIRLYIQICSCGWELGILIAHSSLDNYTVFILIEVRVF